MRVCVFSGSSTGIRPGTRGRRGRSTVLAARGIGVVYGGGHVGLMGELAASALEGGGEVIGVIPEALMAREIAMREVT
jgi:predicted Rossmann-fold nucleotide-binding protein